MTPGETIAEALRLSGMSKAELTRRLGYKAPTSVYEVLGDVHNLSVTKFTRFLGDLEVRVTWDQRNGWQVERDGEKPSLTAR